MKAISDILHNGTLIEAGSEIEEGTFTEEELAHLAEIGVIEAGDTDAVIVSEVSLPPPTSAPEPELEEEEEEDEEDE